MFTCCKYINNNSFKINEKSIIILILVIWRPVKINDCEINQGINI